MRDRPARPAVRPRNAASLILVRRGDAGPEALLGRRGATARFMPGRYVFPGGGIQRADARPWQGETAAGDGTGDRALRIAARAALRETFEETGFVVGRPVGAIGVEPAPGPSPAELSPVERACRDAGLRPALDTLVQIGRAITPTHSPIRFHARFFLADGGLALGPLQVGEELDEVRWYALAEGFPSPMSSVTRFMLQHAVAVWSGARPHAVPLYRHIKGAAKVEWPAPGESRRAG